MLDSVNRTSLRVSGILLVRDGLALVSHRSHLSTYLPLFWEIPGGKEEIGEDQAQCAIREAKEELGIDILEEDLEIIAMRDFSYDFSEIYGPVYACKKWEGEPCGAEGQDVKWVYPDDMYSLDFTPADVKILPEVVSYIKQG